MAASHTRHGRQARFQYNGVNINLSKYRVTWTVADGDTTNFENQTTVGSVATTFETGLPGTTIFDCEVSGWWDAGYNAFDNGLFPGNPVAGPAKLFINTVDGTVYVFPSLRILNVVMDVAVHEVVPFSLTFKSNGSVTYPTGSF